MTREGACCSSSWTREGNDSSQKKDRREGDCHCCHSNDSSQKRQQEMELDVAVIGLGRAMTAAKRMQEKKEFNVAVVGIETAMTAK